MLTLEVSAIAVAIPRAILKAKKEFFFANRARNGNNCEEKSVLLLLRNEEI
jgi:hypothetical protein